MAPPRRLYSESEISKLLKRATELQEREGGGAVVDGLTLEEVEQIARETGIDPTYIRLAATDLASAPETVRRFRILGGPVFLEAERLIEGPLTDETWGAIAAELSRTYREAGKSDAVGSTREWTVGGMRTLREVRVSATPARGKTRIRITEEYGREAFLLFFLPTYMVSIFTGVFMGEGLGLGAGVVVPGIFALALTLFFALRLVFSARVTARERTHQKLLARVEQILVEADQDPVPMRQAGQSDARRPATALEDPVARAAAAHDIVQTPAAGGRVNLPEDDPEPGKTGSHRERTR